MFKVGDRVKCVKVYFCSRDAVGKIGTVIAIKPFFTNCYIIEFDEKIEGGHDGDGSGQDGHCWNFDVSSDCLVLVADKKEEEPVMKFKVGDRVKCVKEFGCSPSTVGKSGTIIGVTQDQKTYGVEFDQKLAFGHNSSTTGARGKDGHCWNFPGKGNYLELAAMQIVTIEVFDRTTVAKLREGDKVIKAGVARCSPTDTFDAYEGARLALDRLYGKSEPYEKRHVRIVKQDTYAVGDKVKIVDNWVAGCRQNSRGLMDEWLGKVMTVRLVDTSDNTYKMDDDKGEGSVGWWWWYHPAIEGRVVEDKPKKVRAVGEVARPAKIGEWIKIVAPCMAGDRYGKGDIKKVTGITLAGNIYIAADGKSTAVWEREYVVLEGYVPEVREVKRKAKAGEYIKIVNKSDSRYDNGDIFHVLMPDQEKHMGVDAKCIVGERSGGQSCYINNHEYVVLEGYEPRKAAA